MKNKISLIYKILILIVSGIGLYMNFNLIGIKNALPFFTILSNIFCFLLYLVIVILELIKHLKKNRHYYIIKGAATMAISITMLVFQFLIAPNGLGVYENGILACEFVHLIVPIMIILDYFIFAEKGHITSNYPLYWSGMLLLYLIFVIIFVYTGHTFNGEKFPYFFLDIDELGFVGVLKYSIVIAIFYTGCGFIVYMIDKKLKKDTK